MINADAEEWLAWYISIISYTSLSGYVFRKNDGNAKYKAKDYRGAISKSYTLISCRNFDIFNIHSETVSYGKAIESDTENVSLLTNRAAAYLMLLQYKEVYPYIY